AGSEREPFEGCGVRGANAVLDLLQVGLDGLPGFGAEARDAGDAVGGVTSHRLVEADPARGARPVLDAVDLDVRVCLELRVIQIIRMTYDPLPLRGVVTCDGRNNVVGLPAGAVDLDRAGVRQQLAEQLDLREVVLGHRLAALLVAGEDREAPVVVLEAVPAP